MLNRLLPWLFVIGANFLLIPASTTANTKNKRTQKREKKRRLNTPDVIWLKMWMFVRTLHSPSNDFIQFHNLTLLSCEFHGQFCWFGQLFAGNHMDLSSSIYQICIKHISPLKEKKDGKHARMHWEIKIDFKWITMRSGRAWYALY